MKLNQTKNVDTTQATTHISLCSGYGGIDLGLKRAIPNLRTVAYSEIEAFACANLVAKMEAGLMDPAPIWSDLKTFPWAELRGKVDILTGGYPCQPFSAAGKRAGKDDPRHLWPWIADGIRLLQPRCCFFENVEGHISLGLSTVISDLEELGYQVSWGIFSASEVGAPHQRKRVFILAYDQRQRIEEFSRCVANESQQHSAGHDGRDVWPSRPGEPQHWWEPPRVVDNADPVAAGRVSGILGCEKGSEQSEGLQRQRPRDAARHASEDCDRQTQSSLGRDADGSSDRMDIAQLYTTCDNRTDELRLLGNGVVPATAEKAFRLLMNQTLV